jgi:hypothetical protein
VGQRGQRGQKHIPEDCARTRNERLAGADSMNSTYWSLNSTYFVVTQLIHYDPPPEVFHSGSGHNGLITILHAHGTVTPVQQWHCPRSPGILIRNLTNLTSFSASTKKLVLLNRGGWWWGDTIIKNKKGPKFWEEVHKATKIQKFEFGEPKKSGYYPKYRKMLPENPAMQRKFEKPKVKIRSVRFQFSFPRFWRGSWGLDLPAFWIPKRWGKLQHESKSEGIASSCCTLCPQSYPQLRHDNPNNPS